MALNEDKQKRIAEIIKDIIISRPNIESIPRLSYEDQNAPFHAAVLALLEKQLKPINVPVPYLVAISNWIYDLDTTLENCYESLAHILSGGYKRKFTGAFTLKVKESQANNIEKIIRELKSGSENPNLKREESLIFDFLKEEKEVDALGFTVDNYFETNDLIEGIELKSVRPNSGEARGEKQKILYAKSAFKLLNPGKEIKYYIGFPFDPTSKTPTGCDKERFFNYLVEFKKFFAFDEVLLAAELWDHLSGQQNTMEEIFEIIRKTVKDSKNS